MTRINLIRSANLTDKWHNDNDRRKNIHDAADNQQKNIKRQQEQQQKYARQDGVENSTADQRMEGSRDKQETTSTVKTSDW